MIGIHGPYSGGDWSFTEKTFVKQSLVLVVQNFAKNSLLYLRGVKQTEGKVYLG